MGPIFGIPEAAMTLGIVLASGLVLVVLLRALNAVHRRPPV
jgi:hypothetical protein